MPTTKSLILRRRKLLEEAAAIEKQLSDSYLSVEQALRDLEIALTPDELRYIVEPSHDGLDAIHRVWQLAEEGKAKFTDDWHVRWVPDHTSPD